MAINLGSGAASSIKLGAQTVSKMYLGAVEVYPNVQPIQGWNTATVQSGDIPSGYYLEMTVSGVDLTFKYLFNGSAFPNCFTMSYDPVAGRFINNPSSGDGRAYAQATTTNMCGDLSTYNIGMHIEGTQNVDQNGLIIRSCDNNNSCGSFSPTLLFNNVDGFTAGTISVGGNYSFSLEGNGDQLRIIYEAYAPSAWVTMAR